MLTAVEELRSRVATVTGCLEKTRASLADNPDPNREVTPDVRTNWHSYRKRPARASLFY